MRPWKFLLAVWLLLPSTAISQNFIVHGPQGDEIAAKFEEIKTDLAVEWFGADAPDFKDPVNVRVVLGKSSGATQYTVVDGYVRSGRMTISAPSLDDLYENTGRHEIMHLLIAKWFGSDLPRWMNEGLATYVEGDRVHQLRRRQMYSALTSRPSRGLPFVSPHRQVTLFGPRDSQQYPSDVSAFYGQSFSVVEFIVPRLGKQGTIRYFEDAIWNPSGSDSPWEAATHKHLQFANLQEFQDHWVSWVSATHSPAGATTSVAQMMGCGGGSCGPSSMMMAPRYAPQTYVLPQSRIVARPWNVPKRITPPRMVDVKPPRTDDPLPATPPPVTTADDLVAAIMKKVTEELKKPQYRGPAGPAGADGSPGPPGENGEPGTVEGVDLSDIESRLAAIENSGIVVELLGERPDGSTFVHESFVIPLGGTAQIPPQVLRIRDGEQQFRVTAPLGEPLKILLEDLEVGGVN